MKSRVISGALYTAVLLVFYLLKIFAPAGSLWFDVLVYAFALQGTFEMLRALGERVTKTEKIIVFCFSALCIPATALGEYFYGSGVAFAGGCFFVLAVALTALLVFKNEETGLESLGCAFLAAVYPTLFLCLLTLANHLAIYSELAVLFIFVISPFADVAAFFTGISLKKKFPKKLAPELSPNKTVVGFIGGLLGGMIGGAIIYFVYGAISETPLHMIWLPVYIGIGLLAALATAFGDLVESCIKRTCGLKDMGKLIPGHGGVLDRIDGTLFATVVVYLAFTVIGLIVL